MGLIARKIRIVEGKNEQVRVFDCVAISSSVTWGSAAANAYLRSHGGGMDGTQFAVILQECISVYRSIGGILSLLGGLGFGKAIELR